MTVEETSFVYKNQKKLRCGITTGSCATAAAYAAAAHLLLGEASERVSLITPKGITIKIPVIFVTEGRSSGNRYMEYKVIKDSGDDPDITNGTEIHVRVSFEAEGCNINENMFESEEYEGLYLDGGAGVGRVTKPGLEQPVGRSAINRIPRKMIFDALETIREKARFTGRLLAVISMPEGERLAGKTFNPRLGIEGGLSVLGTSGIIEPMSERAIVDTIEAVIKQLRGTGVERLVVTPGNYGQGYVTEYLGLSLEDAVKCSNYIGETIDLAVSYGMKSFLLVGNIGKLVKLAAGIMNTHSRVADGRGEIFGVHAAMCGADCETVKELMECINTDKMLEILDKKGLKDSVIKSILGKLEERVSQRIGDAMKFAVVLFSERYGYLGATTGAGELIKLYRR